MHPRLAACLLALTSAAAFGQSLTWSVQPRGVGISADAHENVYTADWDANPAGDITLTKTAPDGSTVFAVRHDNVDPTRHEQATWVQTDSTGGAYVSGNVRAGSFSNPVVVNGLLMRFAADGTLRWRVLLGEDGQSTASFKVLRDVADNAYVLGVGQTPAGLRTRIQKVTAQGAVSLLWYDQAGNGSPANFKWGRNGDLVVAMRAITGTLGGAASVGLDGATRRQATQVPAWSAIDAAVDAQGVLYVASLDPATQQGRLARIGADDGDWIRHDAAAFSRVEASPDGHVVVGGMPGSGSAGVAFLKYSASGDLLWANRDADGPGNMLLLHGQMRLDAAGNVYLAASDLFQMAVTRGHADGTPGWTIKAPSGSAVALDFGAATQAVYVVGGQTARIDQGGAAPGPDLVVTLKDAPDPARVGAKIKLTAVVRNQGTAPADGVMLLQGQQQGVTLVKATTTQGDCAQAQPMVCTLGSIAPGGSVTVKQLIRAQAAGTVITTATASTITTEQDTGNNAATTTTTVTPR